MIKHEKILKYYLTNSKLWYIMYLKIRISQGDLTMKIKKRYLLLSQTNIIVLQADTREEAYNLVIESWKFFRNNLRIYDTLEKRFLKCFVI